MPNCLHDMLEEQRSAQCILQQRWRSACTLSVCIPCSVPRNCVSQESKSTCGGSGSVPSPYAVSPQCLRAAVLEVRGAEMA